MSKQNPTTVGGRTNGSVNKPSSHLRMLLRQLNIQKAAVIPNTEDNSVAAIAVLSETQSGARSLGTNSDPNSDSNAY